MFFARKPPLVNVVIRVLGTVIIAARPIGVVLPHLVGVGLADPVIASHSATLELSKIRSMMFRFPFCSV